MKNRTFLQALASVSIASALLIWSAMQLFPFLQVHTGIAAVSLGLFMAICLLLYWWGRHATAGNSKYAFNGVITSSVLIKMVLSIAVLLVYQKRFAPPNNGYIGIFLSVYVVYTVFEVWFMGKLAKAK
jgi:hypothetical protein